MLRFILFCTNYETFYTNVWYHTCQPQTQKSKIRPTISILSRETPNWSVTFYLFLVWNNEAVTDYLKLCLLRDLQNIEGTPFYAPSPVSRTPKLANLWFLEYKPGQMSDLGYFSATINERVRMPYRPFPPAPSVPALIRPCYPRTHGEQ